MEQDAFMRMVGEVLVKVGTGILERLGSSEQPSPPTVPAVRYASVTAYAKLSGVSEGTLRAWIAAGLPTVPARRGVRVDVPAAEKWIAAGGARLVRPSPRQEKSPSLTPNLSYVDS